MAASLGSTTYSVTTAFTLMVTLSRVITSCGGTSSTSCRRLMRTIWSIGRKTRMMPGPLGAPSTRPSRKITPRSYSRRILIEFRQVENDDGNNNQQRNGQITNRHRKFLSLLSRDCTPLAERSCGRIDSRLCSARRALNLQQQLVVPHHAQRRSLGHRARSPLPARSRPPPARGLAAPALPSRSPAQPTIASAPMRDFRFRARTASRTRNTVIAPNAALTLIATTGLIPISGTGAATSVSMPKVRHTIPAIASAPCPPNFASSRSKTIAATSSRTAV